MTSKELKNFIIEYCMLDMKTYTPMILNSYSELMMASKLVGEEDPFALASYLESMTDESRDTFFKIVKDNKERK